ncbi:MAG: D-aminoacyl-tRNA deacylase [Rikenellaceae bacterium]
MRLLIQRVLQASVEIDQKQVAKIEQGVLLFVGICEEDDLADCDFLAEKVAKMRIFNDEDGVMNLSVKDVDGGVLVVSQFTLMASTKKGNRPSYIKAAPPEISVPLYEAFLKSMSTSLGKNVEHGIFGADMKVNLINDGPVTIWMDTKEK